MTLKQFIKANRPAIDKVINASLNHVPSSASCYCPLSGTEHDHDTRHRLNDFEREEYVINTSELHMLAISQGVRIYE